MTGLNHGFTGAVIALAIKQPALAIPLAYLSHFACDLIPHFGFPDKDLFTRKFNIVLISDFLISVLAMIILGINFPDQKWLIWACMIAAASPDLMWLYYRLYLERIKKIKFKYDPLAKFHHKLQWSQTYPGTFVELAWLVLMSVTVLGYK